MRRSLQLATLLAGLVLIALLGFFRSGDLPTRPPVRRSVDAQGSASGEVGRAPAPPASSSGGQASVESVLADLAAGNVPPDVLTGTFKVTGTVEAPDALGQLALTDSQRTIVDALVAERDARLGEIRREVDLRVPHGADVDRLCAAAQRAQATCLASIRSTLLPDQQGRFDALVKSGKWGGYTLVIPK